MPMPRFHRLPAERQAQFLRVAREHFAEHGTSGASYNKIIAAAGNSKTTAYQYFDGKADLLETVLNDVRARLLGALGPWPDADTAEVFWRQLDDGFARLVGHLAAHPDDHALADAALESADGGYAGDWLAAVVDNGRALGVIRDDVDRALLISVTGAVFRALDTWLIDALRAAPADGAEDQAWRLLAGLWSGPPATGESDDV